jgi:hypothetical protein
MRIKDFLLLHVNKSRIFFINLLIITLSILIVVGFFPETGLAARVTLAWNGTDDPGVRGYRVYGRRDGQNYDYENFSWDGSDTTCVIDGLDDQTAYYFIVRAYTDTDESGDSNEVFFAGSSGSPNQPPTADAGPDQAVDESVTVRLSGANSIDPDDGIASYDWEQIGGPDVDLSDPYEEDVSFTAPQATADGVTLSFRLIVADYSGATSTDTCTVNVSSINMAPTAEAGPDLTVFEEDPVILDASRSVDPDDGIISFQWTQISGIPVALSGADTHMATFNAPIIDSPGESLEFRLIVTDSGGLKSSDTCFVTVSRVDNPPVADAGGDQTVTEGDTVTMDGSGSTDEDDGIAGCQWTQTDGMPVELTDPAACQPEFTAPAVGAEEASLSFKLTVTDRGGLQSQDSCAVQVTPLSEAVGDKVRILRARYRSHRRRLEVRATSDAIAGSVKLTVWAEYGTEVINLGDLRYRRGVYYNTFRRISSRPDYITVTSSDGGTDSQTCD